MKLNKEKFVSVAEQYNLKLIVLFGSRARNETTKLSDIDIAVLAQDVSSLNNAKSQLSLIFDLQYIMKDEGDIDLVILNSASPFLKYQVAMEGITLYEQSEDYFLKFAIQAMKEYEDVRHFDKYYQEIVKDFLKEDYD